MPYDYLSRPHHARGGRGAERQWRARDVGGEIDRPATRFTGAEADFIAQRDSFYLASVSWSDTFELAPTTYTVARAGLALSRAHGFQIWDAVIWCAARSAGAALFLSEDLQDGFELDGMAVINPFKLMDREFAALLVQ